ncbi:hypothetical protein [Streptomyces sp. 8P21H-1]|uniref:hypothetical protein n=1 Tax=Streptomyces sp. 8P21H-1 TaxID=2737048 RepID=UPI001C2DC188|nr:hypothetical protein [Streptomyces sp. 8P21H-1]
MPSMRAVLEARQNAAASQVKELQAELERVRAALAGTEEVHRCRVIGLEQYLEALAEEAAPPGVVGEVSRKKAVGPRRAVPHRRQATEVKESSPDCQALTAAAADAGNDGPGAGGGGAGPGQRVRLLLGATRRHPHVSGAHPAADRRSHHRDPVADHRRQARRDRLRTAPMFRVRTGRGG